MKATFARKHLAAAVALALAAGVLGSGQAWADRNDDRVFRLSGNAERAQDPENPANDVIKINTAAPPAFGAVSRTLNVKINTLDNQLEFKSYFQARSCGGGSPRIQLEVDLDGDGKADGNAFGHWPPPPFAGCPPNVWMYQDLTDLLPRWDLSQLAARGLPIPSCTPPQNDPLGLCPFPTHSGYVPWEVFETVLTVVFPNHKVCNGALVDDSGWFPPAAGVAYYDLISIGNATYNDHSDIAGRGFAQGCRTRNGDGDDDDDDD
jgi:hypothetical protein